MKRFLVCAAVSVAMFLMISCGGSESSDGDNNNDNGNGENTEENNNDNSSTEDSSGCTKITPKWTETDYDDSDNEKEFILLGTYSPKTGNNPDYGDAISFRIEYSGKPKEEYDFSPTADAGVYVLEGWRGSDSEETEHDNEFDKAYISVSGKVKINTLDVENKHASISLQNVKLMEATINRDNEDNKWSMVKDGACLFIESSSFEQ